MKARFGLLALLRIPTLALLGCMMLATALVAHHGNAIYDTSKTVTVKGVVVDWFWGNPHCLLNFDVKDEKGAVVHWVAELSNPPDIMAHGWSRKMLKTDDEISITMMVAKNGEPVGRIFSVVVDGKTYEGGSPGGPPTK